LGTGFLFPGFFFRFPKKKKTNGGRGGDPRRGDAALLSPPPQNHKPRNLENGGGGGKKNRVVFFWQRGGGGEGDKKGPPRGGGGGGGVGARSVLVGGKNNFFAGPSGNGGKSPFLWGFPGFLFFRGDPVSKKKKHRGGPRTFFQTPLCRPGGLLVRPPNFTRVEGAREVVFFGRGAGGHPPPGPV